VNSCSINPICSRPRTPSVGLPRFLANAAHAGGDTSKCAAMKKHHSTGREHIDISGKKYGKLTPIKYIRGSKWLCRCDCGGESTVQTINLSSGHTKSCGCLPCGKIKHGHATNYKPSPTFQTWSGMKKRCTNKACKDFKEYGGRGIKVCERWLDSFENFLADMGERPRGLSLGRKDNNLGYFPENCQWETLEQQANNKRNNHNIEISGVVKTISQWAREYGLPADCCFCRIRRGWDKVDAVTTPRRARGG
jgi:hypothetical protein